MSSTFSISGSYIAYLSKQTTAPPATQNPVAQKPAAESALKTSGPTGQSLNITA